MAGDARRKVLVVDDDRMTLAMLTDILASGFDVETAANGDEAVEALRHHEFTAILSDHMMPGMTGVEVLGKCQQMQPTAARILVTASENIEDIRDAVNVARVHRVVIKPIREVEIDAAVTAALRECELEQENERLIAELKKALAELQAREVELETELRVRTQELRELTERLVRAGG